MAFESKTTFCPSSKSIVDLTTLLNAQTPFEFIHQAQTTDSYVEIKDLVVQDGDYYWNTIKRNEQLCYETDKYGIAKVAKPLHLYDANYEKFNIATVQKCLSHPGGILGRELIVMLVKAEITQPVLGTFKFTMAGPVKNDDKTLPEWLAKFTEPLIYDDGRIYSQCEFDAIVGDLSINKAWVPTAKMQIGPIQIMTLPTEWKALKYINRHKQYEDIWEEL